MVRKLLSDFDQILNWSIMHQQIFAPAKFNLLNCGASNRKLPKNRKCMVKYDNKQVNWEPSANFLGVTFDSNFTFKREMQHLLSKMIKSNSILRPDCDAQYGCSIGRLLQIFDENVLVHTLHGSALWIFSVFPNIRLTASPAKNCESWKVLASFYHRSLSMICQSRRGTSRIALLVRLGRLPLHYHIAFHAMATYYKILRHNPSPALTHQHQHFTDNETLNSTLFYAPALQNITYFERYTQPHVSLMELPSMNAFKCRLRKAMFNELSSSWQNLHVGRHTFHHSLLGSHDISRCYQLRDEQKRTMSDLALPRTTQEHPDVHPRTFQIQRAHIADYRPKLSLTSIWNAQPTMQQDIPYSLISSLSLPKKSSQILITQFKCKSLYQPRSYRELRIMKIKMKSLLAAEHQVNSL